MDMVTCRSVSEAVWKQAREALIFYFAHRVGFTNAEDLAQETLMAFWRRDDYEFEEEGDVPRICYAFARRVLRAALRTDKTYLNAALNDALQAPEKNLFGLNSTEMGIYLDEVLAAARSGMLEHEWRSIENRARFEEYGEAASVDEAEQNRLRVQFHRAKGKLALLMKRGKKQ